MMLEKHHGFLEKDVVIMKLRMSSTLSAEAISMLSDEAVLQQRNKQTDALNYSLHNLYGTKSQIQLRSLQKQSKYLDHLQIGRASCRERV